MKRVLQIFALAVAFAAVLFWLAAGAQRGWTKTSTPVKSVDQVTGIEGITYKKQFVPGLDFIGAALLGAGFLAGASLFFRKTKSTTNSNTTTNI
jgi:hypothetical protein